MTKPVKDVMDRLKSAGVGAVFHFISNNPGSYVKISRKKRGFKIIGEQGFVSAYDIATMHSGNKIITENA